MAITLDQKVIFAARSGNLMLLKERVASGGTLNYVNPAHGTALTEAVRCGHYEVVRWLIENGSDVNLELRHGIGPLELALRHSDPEVVKLLVWSGAKLKRKSRAYYAERLENCLKAGKSGTASEQS